MVEHKKYGVPPYNRREIFRYAGMRVPSLEVEQLLDSCLGELAEKVNFQVCWARFPVKQIGMELDLSFMKTGSLDLQKMMRGCSGAVVFGATVGLEIDRLIVRYSRISPARALMFQAIGAERIEKLCDLFEHEIREEQWKLGYAITPRFSPGYGDLPLESQRAIFGVLDCPRKIGLTLNDSLLMTPTKSVTAIIGIGKYPEEKEDAASG